MVRVIDYINQASPAAVVEEYTSTYAYDSWASEEAFNEFKSVLNAKIGVLPENSMTVRIFLQKQDDEESFIAVDGVDNSDLKWALDMTSWSRWREMEVIDDTGLFLSVSQIAAHVYQEITWHGWEESMEERRDELHDRIEQLRRDIDSGKYK